MTEQKKQQISDDLKALCRKHDIGNMVTIFETNTIAPQTGVLQIAIPIQCKSPFYTYIFDQLNDGMKQEVKTKNT